MSLTQYYTATTLDGFIADEHDSLDWLFTRARDEDGPLAYERFYEGVGAVAMGSTTYEWILDHAFGDKARASGCGRTRTCRAGCSRRGSSGRCRAPTSASCAAVGPVHAEMVTAAGERNVWIVGGGPLVAQFADAELLDEVLATIAPVTLGAGRPLLPTRVELRLEETGGTATSSLRATRWRASAADDACGPSPSPAVRAISFRSSRSRARRRRPGTPSRSRGKGRWSRRSRRPGSRRSTPVAGRCCTRRSGRRCSRSTRRREGARARDLRGEGRAHARRHRARAVRRVASGRARLRGGRLRRGRCGGAAGSATRELPLHRVRVVRLGGARGRAAERAARRARPVARPRVEMSRRHLVLSPFPASFRDPRSPLPPNTQLVRPVSPEADAVFEDVEGPLVYFTLGTIFNLEPATCSSACSQDCGSLPATVVVDGARGRPGKGRTAAPERARRELRAAGIAPAPVQPRRLARRLWQRDRRARARRPDGAAADGR